LTKSGQPDGSGKSQNDNHYNGKLTIDKGKLAMGLLQNGINPIGVEFG
jgi:hypothetical protein